MFFLFFNMVFYFLYLCFTFLLELFIVSQFAFILYFINSHIDFYTHILTCACMQTY